MTYIHSIITNNNKHEIHAALTAISEELEDHLSISSPVHSDIIDMDGNRVINVADAVDSNDLVTRSLMESLLAPIPVVQIPCNGVALNNTGSVWQGFITEFLTNPERIRFGDSGFNSTLNHLFLIKSNWSQHFKQRVKYQEMSNQGLDDEGKTRKVAGLSMDLGGIYGGDKYIATIDADNNTLQLVRGTDIVTTPITGYVPGGIYSLEFTWNPETKIATANYRIGSSEDVSASVQLPFSQIALTLGGFIFLGLQTESGHISHIDILEWCQGEVAPAPNPVVISGIPYSEFDVSGTVYPMTTPSRIRLEAITGGNNYIERDGETVDWNSPWSFKLGIQQMKGEGLPTRGYSEKKGSLRVFVEHGGFDSLVLSIDDNGLFKLVYRESGEPDVESQVSTTYTDGGHYVLEFAYNGGDTVTGRLYADGSSTAQDVVSITNPSIDIGLVRPEPSVTLLNGNGVYSAVDIHTWGIT